MARARNLWTWHVRVRLCALGLASCNVPGHGGGRVDALWLRPNLTGRWTN